MLFDFMCIIVILEARSATDTICRDARLTFRIRLSVHSQLADSRKHPWIENRALLVQLGMYRSSIQIQGVCSLSTLGTMLNGAVQSHKT